MVSDIDIAITILAALLTGGFILFFVENQHIESDVISRYYARMDPYYHKLSLYLKFVYFLDSRIEYANPNSAYTDDFKSIVKHLSRIGCNIHSIGKDISYLHSIQLEDLNRKINNVWYFNDKDPFIQKSNLQQPYIFSDQDISETLAELKDKYKTLPVEFGLLPKISGEFYCEIYQPVEFVVNEYENWKGKSSTSKYILIMCLLIVMIILIVAMFTSSIIHPLIITIPTALCCFAFLITIYKLNGLMELSHRIFK